MGLDCSHDAFHGAYSAFNRLRQAVCYAMGGSFPPHFKLNPDGTFMYNAEGTMHIVDKTIPEDIWQCSDKYTEESHPGLYEFMTHSDCDGEISPDMCIKVADELEALLPKVAALKIEATGHIEHQGGYVEVLKRFIEGCRCAAKRYEPLEFH